MNKIYYLRIVFFPFLLIIMTGGCFFDDGPGKKGGDNEIEVKRSFYLKYDGNNNSSGEVPVGMAFYPEGHTITILDNSKNLEKTGYSFQGWCTSEDGTGDCYKPDDTFNMANGDLVLFAKWVKIYSVLYKGNGNTGGVVPVDNKNYIEGSTVTVLENTGNLTKEEISGEILKLDGWNTQPDGKGTNYTVGSGTFLMKDDEVTLYANWRTYQVGDTGPSGGFVFYDKGVFSGGWRFMEAAPASTEDYAKWNVNQWIGVTDTGLATGSGNTVTIIALLNSNSQTGMAAQICDDLSFVKDGVTYGDWFLPSKDELNLMYGNLKNQGIGDFLEQGYWSSSEIDATETSYQSFINGYQAGYTKYQERYVRAVRDF